MRGTGRFGGSPFYLCRHSFSDPIIHAALAQGIGLSGPGEPSVESAEAPRHVLEVFRTLRERPVSARLREALRYSDCRFELLLYNGRELAKEWRLFLLDLCFHEKEPLSRPPRTSILPFSLGRKSIVWASTGRRIRACAVQPFPAPSPSRSACGQRPSFCAPCRWRGPDPCEDLLCSRGCFRGQVTTARLQINSTLASWLICNKADMGISNCWLPVSFSLWILNSGGEDGCYVWAPNSQTASAFRAFFILIVPQSNACAWHTRVHTCTFPPPVSEALPSAVFLLGSQAPNMSGWVIWPERAPGFLSLRGCHRSCSLIYLAWVCLFHWVDGWTWVNPSSMEDPGPSFCQAWPFHQDSWGCSLNLDDGRPALPSRFGQSFIRYGQFLAGN